MSGTMKLYLENLSQKKANDSREKTGDKKSKQKELVFISMNESRVRPTSLCGIQLVFFLAQSPDGCDGPESFANTGNCRGQDSKLVLDVVQTIC